MNSLVVNLRRVSAIVLAVFLTTGFAELHAESPDRGAYLVAIMACADCHAPRRADGTLQADKGLSGGAFGFEIGPSNIVWGPNITPDESGIGNWSAQEIIDAIRAGIRPDGRVLAPVMPWHLFSVLTDEDAVAIARFLQSQPPISSANDGLGGPSPRPFFRLISSE